MIFKYVTVGTPPQADRKSVNAMLECYTQTKNCSLYRLVGTPNGFPYIGNLDEGPHPQYISVHSSYHTEMTKQILQYFTGDLDQDRNCTDPEERIVLKDHCQEVCLEKNREQQIYSYQFMVGSQDCFNSTGTILSIVTLNCTNHVLYYKILAFAPLAPSAFVFEGVGWTRKMAEKTVLWIHLILFWLGLRGSAPENKGFGSGS